MIDNVIATDDPRAEESEPPVIIVNIRTGKIREIPCGPIDAAHFSGRRIVYWNKMAGRAEIPRKHAREWRFYADFCADPNVAKAAGLSVEESALYFAAYREFIAIRGHGAKAKHINYSVEQVRKLWHPALLELRKDHESARGQARIDPGMLEAITARLGGKEKPSDNAK